MASINHVGLYVSDLEASRVFFETNLSTGREPRVTVIMKVRCSTPREMWLK